MKTNYSRLLVCTVLGFSLLGCGSTSGEKNESPADLIKPDLIAPADVPASFIKGVDISILPEVEKLGGVYYQDGQEKDALEIFRDHGVNYVRMRVWLDPKDEQGVPYGGGQVTLDDAIAVGERAKALGMSYLLDLHYSDFWTDPAKQFKPKAWKELPFDSLVKEVYNYTFNVLAEHRKAGIMPNMIQIGNELNSGMLWPEGKNWGGDGNEFDRLAALLNAGVQAVKDSYHEDEPVKIMLHLAEAGKNETFRWWFDEITKRNVPFDVIGMSYYPFWHGPMSAVKTNMDDIASRYGKPVMIVETSYAYTSENGDALGNSFDGLTPAEGYPVSVEGQAKYLKDIMELVASVPNGLGQGLFYWEPSWLPVPGVTWATKEGMKYIDDEWAEGNSWDNQALFDFKGNMLPSMNVFKPAQ